MKTLPELLEILNKAQISYSRELSHIYGSEYWSIAGVGYRLSDHPKSEWRKSENIQIPLGKDKDYQRFYDHLLSRKDIDLSDKTEIEKAFKINAVKTLIKTGQKLKDKDIYKTEDGAQFDDIDNAVSYLWRKKLKQDQLNLEKGGDEDSYAKHGAKIKPDKYYNTEGFLKCPHCGSSEK